MSDLWVVTGDRTAPEFWNPYRTRFYLLLRVLLFYDINNGVQRKKQDKLVPIRDLFGTFQERGQP